MRRERTRSGSGTPSRLLRAIDAAAEPETARVLRGYFQVRPGGYGEGDTFVGVRLSVLRGLTTWST